MIRALLVLTLCHFAQAQSLSWGGTSMTRAGSQTADPDNTFAPAENPALMAASEKRFTFSSRFGATQFRPLGQVLVDSTQFRTLEGDRDRVEERNLEDVSVSQWEASLQYPFLALNRRFALGFAVGGPFETLRTFRSQTPYDFQVLRHGTADSQFRANVGASVELYEERLFFGVGSSFYMTVSGAGDSVLLSEDPTGRLYLDVGLNATAVAGLYYQGGDLSASFVFRQAKNPRIYQEVTGRVQVAEGADSLPLFQAFQASLYYEPEVWAGDIQVKPGWGKISFGLGVERWSAYQPPFTQIISENREGEQITTELPKLNMHDTVNPRISIQGPIGSGIELGAGYQYRPTPLPDSAMSGEANLLDSATHVIGLGGQVDLGPGWVLSVFSQFQVLMPRTVVKDDPSFIGSPGYEFRGWGYQAGLSLQAAL